jgi:hypothetical protein
MRQRSLARSTKRWKLTSSGSVESQYLVGSFSASGHSIDQQPLFRSTFGELVITMRHEPECEQSARTAARPDHATVGDHADPAYCKALTQAVDHRNQGCHVGGPAALGLPAARFRRTQIGPPAPLPAQEPERSAEALRRVLPELCKLQRYEHRAASRRDRALRRITTKGR